MFSGQHNALFLCYIVRDFIISCLRFFMGPTTSVVDAEPTFADASPTSGRGAKRQCADVVLRRRADQSMLTFGRLLNCLLGAAMPYFYATSLVVLFPVVCFFIACKFA